MSTYSTSFAIFLVVLIAVDSSIQSPALRGFQEGFEVSSCGVVAFGQNREGREASPCTNFEYHADDRWFASSCYFRM
jgi:hypothetical protein